MVGKVLQGQKFKPLASDWNAFAESANAERGKTHDLRFGADRQDDGSVLIKYSGDTAVPLFGVLELYDCEQRGSEFSVIPMARMPSSQWASNVCIAAQPISPGEEVLSRAWVSGYRIALLYVPGHTIVVPPVVGRCRGSGFAIEPVWAGSKTSLTGSGSGTVLVAGITEQSGPDGTIIGFVRLGGGC